MRICRINLCRATLILAVTLFAFAAPGCAVPGFGGAGSGKSARSGAGVPSGPGGAAGEPDDISAFSPEVSMQRDLLQLREREAGQRETVENMRLALRQGGEDVAREEERLRDIQMQIERYDSAMRRYEMAGRYALPSDGRGDVAQPAQARRAPAGPAGLDSGYGDYDMGNSYAAGRGVAGEPVRFQQQNAGGEYGREGNLSRSGGREEMLYAGAYDPRLAEQPAPVGDLTLRRAAGRAPAQRRPMFEDDAAEAGLFAAPDAGAFAPRTAGDVWSTPQPASVRAGAEQLAAAPGRVQPVGQRKPAPSAPPAAAPQMRPAVAEDDGMDEVFTPDLFLSRR